MYEHGQLRCSANIFICLNAWLDAGNWFGKGAGAIIELMGLYFVARPFIDNPSV